MLDEERGRGREGGERVGEDSYIHISSHFRQPICRKVNCLN